MRLMLLLLFTLILFSGVGYGVKIINENFVSDCKNKIEIFYESKDKEIDSWEDVNYLTTETGRCIVKFDDLWYDITEEAFVIE